MQPGMRSIHEHQIHELEHGLDECIDHLIEESVAESLFIRRSAKDLEHHVVRAEGVLADYQTYRVRIEASQRRMFEHIRLLVELKVLGISD
jgi:hypothetical protein